MKRDLVISQRPSVLQQGRLLKGPQRFNSNMGWPSLWGTSHWGHSQGHVVCCWMHTMCTWEKCTLVIVLSVPEMQAQSAFLQLFSTCLCMLTCRAEDNLRELAFLFQRVSPRDWIPTLWLGAFTPLTCLVYPSWLIILSSLLSSLILFTYSNYIQLHKEELWN